MSDAIKIGCFEVKHLVGERWSVLNTKTTFSHVTYGTFEEIEEQLEIQSRYWEQRFSNSPKLRSDSFKQARRK